MALRTLTEHLSDNAAPDGREKEYVVPEQYGSDRLFGLRRLLRHEEREDGVR